MQFMVNQLQVELISDDITQLNTDAITNAANSQLVLGAGVAGAIAAAGGDSIQAECDAIGYCEVGSAVITKGGNLRARYVIHAVGPRMGEGDEHRKLASAIRATLVLAEQNQLASVALPAISTGIFGFPKNDCAQIMAEEIFFFGKTARHHLQKVVVCLYNEDDLVLFDNTFRALWAEHAD